MRQMDRRSRSSTRPPASVSRRLPRQPRRMCRERWHPRRRRSTRRPGADWRQPSAAGSCGAWPARFASAPKNSPRSRAATTASRCARRAPTCRSPRATSSSLPASPTRSWATPSPSGQVSSTTPSVSRSVSRRRSCRGTTRYKSARVGSRRRWQQGARSCSSRRAKPR